MTTPTQEMLIYTINALHMRLQGCMTQLSAALPTANFDTTVSLPVNISRELSRLKLKGFDDVACTMRLIAKHTGVTIPEITNWFEQGHDDKWFGDIRKLLTEYWDFDPYNSIPWRLPAPTPGETQALEGEHYRLTFEPSREWGKSGILYVLTVRHPHHADIQCTFFSHRNNSDYATIKTPIAHLDETLAHSFCEVVGSHGWFETNVIAPLRAQLDALVAQAYPQHTEQELLDLILAHRQWMESNPLPFQEDQGASRSVYWETKDISFYHGYTDEKRALLVTLVRGEIRTSLQYNTGDETFTVKAARIHRSNHTFNVHYTNTPILLGETYQTLAKALAVTGYRPEDHHVTAETSSITPDPQE
jgi:hypothetical protein